MTTADRDETARGVDVAAVVTVLAIAFLVYARTLLPGPSVGDWAEMQWLPARLGIPHPTGYPLYILIGWVFSLIPVGSHAIRAELLSAVAAAGASGVCVLIARRLGARAIVAIAAGLALAFTGELWLEATFSEMNGFHLLLMAAVIHRALVWQADRRDRDLRIGAFLAGLSLANHLLAVTVVPVVVVWVLVDARARLRERPILLLEAFALGIAGLLPYVFIPLRGLFPPAELYARFTTWDGFASLVSGADLRGQMHFLAPETFGATWADVPSIVGQLVERSNIPFVALAGLGALIALAKRPWYASMALVIVAINWYIFASYVGDLDHYLLVTWLVLATFAGIALEAAIRAAERLFGRDGVVRFAPVLALLLPVSVFAGNVGVSDQSSNHDGERFADAVFAALPQNAVLLSYWDALTTLGYEHCAEGRRPDVAFRAFDPGARIVCDPVDAPLELVARERPLYALFAVDSELNAVRGAFRLEAGPTIAVPYGKRGLDHSATLYRLVPIASALRSPPGDGTGCREIRPQTPSAAPPFRSSAAARCTARTIG